MNTTTELGDLARRLLAIEASPKETSRFASSFVVCRKLREPLVKLAGTEGFRALLSRSLSLATTQDPRLGSLRVSPDGALEENDHAPVQDGHPSWADAEAQLIAQLLGLLATFIGQTLTLHLVQGVWPNLADEGTPSGNTS